MTNENVQLATPTKKIFNFKSLVLSLFVSFISLIFSSIVIPKVMSPSDFGEWRTVITYLVYVGVAHLGFADGLLIYWSRNHAAEIPGKALGFAVGVIFVISLISSITVTVQSGFNITMLLLFFILSCLMASYAILLTYAQSFLNGKEFLLMTSLQPILFSSTIVLLFATAQLQTQALMIGLITSFLVPLVIFYNNVSINFKNNLPFLYFIINPSNGLAIMIGNFIFLAYLNLDKLILIRYLSNKEMGNYALSSIVVGATASIFAPVGSIILSRNLLNRSHIRLYAWLTTIVFIFVVLLFRDSIQLLMLRVFPNYQIPLFSVFIINAILIVLIVVYYLPLEKQIYSSKFPLVMLTSLISLAIGIYVFQPIFSWELAGAVSLLTSSVYSIIRAEISYIYYYKNKFRIAN